MDEESSPISSGECLPLPSHEDANLPSVITSPYCADGSSSTLQHEDMDKSGLDCSDEAMQLEGGDAAVADLHATCTPTLSFLPSPVNMNHNNSNITATDFPAEHHLVTTVSGDEACNPDEQKPPQQQPVILRSRPKVCSKHPPVEVTLDGRDLWDQFYRRGTEMIVNRAGRRMFPGFAASITGLKPKAKYSIRLAVVLADNHRFKFLNSRWLAVGSSEPQSPTTTYVHPDSPNTGSFWTRHGISFKKLKITNNKDKPGQNALLHSMHKYYLRLIVDEEKKNHPGEPKQPARNILTQDFFETSFIAVTAYQNEEVTQLKITNNPFAKAFRENSSDLDYETAQALYGHPSHGYMSASPGFASPGHMLASPAGQWTIQSPLISPHPMTPGISPHISAISGFSPSSSPRVPQSLPAGAVAAPAQYFQWPQQQRAITAGQFQPLQPSVPTTPGGFFQQQQQSQSGTSGLDTSPPIYFTGQSPQLPDFESVFTTPTSGSSQS